MITPLVVYCERFQVCFWCACRTFHSLPLLITAHHKHINTCILSSLTLARHWLNTTRKGHPFPMEIISILVFSSTNSPWRLLSILEWIALSKIECSSKLKNQKTKNTTNHSIVFELTFAANFISDSKFNSNSESDWVFLLLLCASNRRMNRLVFWQQTLRKVHIAMTLKTKRKSAN